MCLVAFDLFAISKPVYYTEDMNNIYHTQPSLTCVWMCIGKKIIRAVQSCWSDDHTANVFEASSASFSSHHPACWKLNHCPEHACQQRASSMTPTFNLVAIVLSHGMLSYKCLQRLCFWVFMLKTPPPNPHFPTPTMMGSWCYGWSPRVKQIEYAHRNKAGGFSGLW